MTTLLLSSRQTGDAQLLWRAAVSRGWPVVRARGISVPTIEDNDIVIYVEALFAPEIAKRLNRRLLEPAEDWLTKLPSTLTHRKMTLTTIGEARLFDKPTFIKPPNDKSFLAQVFNSGAELSTDFEDHTSVLTSTPVQFESEYRCFCLDGSVVTHSPYVTNRELAAEYNYKITPDESVNVVATAESALSYSNFGLPRAVVIDVGKLDNGAWAVVEANGAWGAGIYGCDPNLVLDVIRHCTVNHQSSG